MVKKRKLSAARVTNPVVAITLRSVRCVYIFFVGVTAKVGDAPYQCWNPAINRK